MNRATAFGFFFVSAAIALAAVATTAFSTAATATTTATPEPTLTALGPSRRVESFSFLGKPKYLPGFDHFNIANPEAPKGGILRLGNQGTFDNLNLFLAKGAKARSVSFTLQFLTYTPSDDSHAAYGLVARDFDLALDKTWMVVNLRKEARWHDGTSITAADVVFTFQSLLSSAAQPFYRQTFVDVISAQELDSHRVLFRFKNGENRELPQVVAGLPVLSKKYYETHDFSTTTLTAPMGSGPYRIVSVDPGRHLVLERVKDYWAANLPVQKGLFHFDRIDIEYYRSDITLFEAFKAGSIDFREESTAARWAHSYNFNAVAEGCVVRRLLSKEGEANYPTAFVFNMRKQKFQHIKVRQALAQLYDFDWVNFNFYHNAYQRANSYFEGSRDLMPRELPSAAELELLRPLSVPPQVFTEVYQSPPYHGRDSIRKALDLLAEAGFVLRRASSTSPGYVIDPTTDKPLTLEFLVDDPSMERTVLAFGNTLRRAGIASTVRTVDASQYQNRLKTFDFDVIYSALMGPETPGSEQYDFLGSQAVDTESTYNFAGVADPAVDALVEKLVVAQERDEVVTAARALDRVLMWNYYFLPGLTYPFNRIAYWNKFGFVAPVPNQQSSPWADWWSQPLPSNCKAR